MSKRSEYMKRYRERKKARGECRECKLAAVIKNGKSLDLCAEHLKADRERKTDG